MCCVLLAKTAKMWGVGMSLAKTPKMWEVGTAKMWGVGHAAASGGMRDADTRRDPAVHVDVVFFFALVTGPRRSLSLKLSDVRVYEPQIRPRLGTTVRAN